ncbi:hypothetical protein [Halocola ammonii]
MNKDQFYKQLEQPQLLSRDDIDSLQELVEQYPYFASARVLLAKALHSANDHRFDEALQQAAVFAGDRKVLYNLVMKENLKQKIRDVNEAVSKETEEVEEEVEKQTEPENSEVSDQEEIEAQGETVVEEPSEKEEGTEVEVKEFESSTELEEEKDEDVEKVEKPDSEIEEDEEEGESEQTYDEYEQEILYEAINSTISREVSEDEEEEDKDEAQTASKPEGSVSEVAPDKETDEVKESASPTSYSEWLKKRAREIHYHEDSVEEKASQQSKSTVDQAVNAEQKVAEEEGSNSPSQDELIERFIEKEPKITPKKADMFSSENLAKMSVVEDESFVTETMAKIFAKQGNLRKAKRAYKLLSLKYPEKSIYFANQIKKLQGKK